MTSEGGQDVGGVGGNDVESSAYTWVIHWLKMKTFTIENVSDFNLFLNFEREVSVWTKSIFYKKTARLALQKCICGQLSCVLL